MDAGTTRDFIQDLQEENARLHQAIATLCAEMTVLESEVSNWRNIAHRLYNPWTHMEGVDMYQKARHD
jgi:ribosomal protein L18E